MNRSSNNPYDSQNDIEQISNCEQPFHVSTEYLEELGYPDVSLVIEDETLECHKEILSTSSEYFKAMFERPMKERNLDTIDLKCVPANSFKIILDFCYKKPLLIDRENIFDVTRTADMLAFTDVYTRCKDFLWDHVNQNCFAVLMLASTLFMTDLYDYCKAYALWYFNQVADNEDLLDLTLDELKAFLSDRRLNTTDELLVFRTLVKWVEHDVENRSKNFESLFHSCLCLPSLGDEQIQVLQSFELLSKFPKCLSTLLSSCDQPARNGLQNDDYKDEMRVECREIPKALLWVGGDKSKTSNNFPSPNWSIMRWDPPKKGYIKIDDMYPVKTPVEADMGYRVCTLGVEIYVLGGEAKLGSNKWQMNIWSYNMLRRKWTMKASLLEPRRHHAVCVMDNDIYVIGGFTKHRIITSSVHCYHSDNDSWTVCSELIRPEFAATATSVNHRVYLFKTLDIQSYNLDTNQWTIVTTDVPPAKTPGFTVMSAITVGSKIIIQGGYNNMLYQYDPSVIDQNEAWTCLGQYKDVFGSCAELDGKIYCMGNDCDHMETYDLTTHEFGVEMSVSCQLSRSFLVTLPFYKETMQ